jgi:hypothetical protein
MQKPEKPFPEFPLFAHSNGQWAKKIKGRVYYFGPWSDYEKALRQFNDYLLKSMECKRTCIKVGKPKKPCKNFPLYPHASGQWAKKVKYNVYYFGPWDDPQGALRRWLERRDDIIAGRETCRKCLTVEALVGKFIESRNRLVESGEITSRHVVDCKRSLARAITKIGKKNIEDLSPSDFAELRAYLAKGRGVESLSNDIAKIRAMFNYAIANEWASAIRYGKEFSKPSASVMRVHRAKKGVLMFKPSHIRKLLLLADRNLRAMILLGINAGLGNNDIATLRWHHISNGWLSYARPKTGAPRKCKLWPETLAALAQLKTKDYVFVTKRGNPWTPKGDQTSSPITHAMRKLLITAGLSNTGLGFYSLRRTFETVAGETEDQIATDYVMGHVSSGMAARYRQRMLDSRLTKVANHVRKWLNPSLVVHASPVGKT